MNGDWCAWVRRMVRRADDSQETGLETEYTTGICWLHGVKVSSALNVPEGIPEKELLRDDSRPTRPWIHVEKIAVVMKRTRPFLEQCAAETKR